MGWVPRLMFAAWAAVSFTWAACVAIAALAGRSAIAVGWAPLASLALLPPAALLLVGWAVIETARNWHRKAIRLIVTAAFGLFVAARALEWLSHSLLPAAPWAAIHAILTASPTVFVTHIVPGGMMLGALLAVRFGATAASLASMISESTRLPATSRSAPPPPARRRASRRSRNG